MRLRLIAALGLLAACGPSDGAAGDGGAGDAARIDAAGQGDAASPDAGPRPYTAPGAVAITCGEVAIPSEGKADCAIRIAWAEGDVAYEGPVGVGIHGRSSSAFPKRQYAIELRDAVGADDEVDLFGMGAEADWLLNGMYLDRALVRNRLAYELFREMGGWAPETRYVELTLDGEPQGVYLLTERVERDASRLDLPPDDGTGVRFIVRGDEEGIASTVQYADWMVMYPEPAPEGVATRLAAFEAAIPGTDEAVFDELDRATAIDFVLLEEGLKNNDAYFLSQHLYTGADGVLRLAPWDLDLTLGQPSYNDNELSSGWLLYRSALIAGLAARASFQTAIVARWEALREGPWATDAIVGRIEAERAFLGDALERNWEVWDLQAVDDTWFPIYPVASVDEEYALVEAWIADRLAWVDDNIDAYAD